jgi:hypothetical protein
MNQWKTSIPIYVTRPTADGTIGNVSLEAWLLVTFFLLAQINFVVWSLVSLLIAFRVVF